MNSQSVTQTLEFLRVIKTTISGWTGYALSISNTGSGSLNPLWTVSQSILNILDDLLSGGKDDDSTNNQSDNVTQHIPYMVSFTDTNLIWAVTWKQDICENKPISQQASIIDSIVNWSCICAPWWINCTHRRRCYLNYTKIRGQSICAYLQGLLVRFSQPTGGWPPTLIFNIFFTYLSVSCCNLFQRVPYLYHC